jgi:hypothetical protein
MALQPIDTGLWCLPGQFGSKLMPGSTRMTVLEGDGGLVLHSPVALTRDDVQAIEAIGPVTAILAPNTYHHLYLRAAAEAFPGASVFVPEGLEEKIGPVPRAATISRAHPPALPGRIEHFIVERHMVRECLLFHSATRTLVTADMLYNYQPENGRWEKLMFGLIGCYGSPKVAFYHRFAIRDKAAVHEMVGAVRAWQPRRIVLAHGRIVEGEDAAETFARAWRRFA